MIITHPPLPDLSSSYPPNQLSSDMAQGPRLPLRITLPPTHYIDVQNGVLTYQSLTPSALRALTRELAQLRSDPPEDVRVVVNEEDLSSLEGWVAGPGTSIFPSKRSLRYCTGGVR